MLGVFGDPMMAHEKPSLSSLAYIACLFKNLTFSIRHLPCEVLANGSIVTTRYLHVIAVQNKA